MPMYLVLAIDIHDEEAYKKYTEGARLAMRGTKVKPIAFDRSPVAYEGDKPANYMMVLEVESKEAFDEFFNSEEYKKVVPFRHAAADTRFHHRAEGGRRRVTPATHPLQTHQSTEET